MSAATIALVLFAAFLHALWNALVKGAEDRAGMLGLIALGHLPPGVLLVAISPPPAWASLPYMIASIVIHWGYYYLLNIAYRFGDLSLVYPIARGLAPVLVAVTAQLWIGEQLPSVAWAGMIAVSGGIMLLTGGGLRGAIPITGALAAMGVAVIIAAYSVVDGIGVRLSESVFGYIGWLFVAEILIAAFIFGRERDRLAALPWRAIALGVGGGALSGAAYGLVLYAKTLAPLGLVSALRETSVIVAALIGVLWFHERPWQIRVAAAAIVALGIVLIGLAG